MYPWFWTFFVGWVESHFAPTVGTLVDWGGTFSGCPRYSRFRADGHTVYLQFSTDGLTWSDVLHYDPTPSPTLLNVWSYVQDAWAFFAWWFNN